MSREKGGSAASKIKAKKRSRIEAVCEKLGNHLEQNDSMPQLLPKPSASSAPPHSHHGGICVIKSIKETRSSLAPNLSFLIFLFNVRAM